MNIGKKQFANGEHLSKNALTFSRVFEQVDDFLRYCWTNFSLYMCFTMFSEALRTPQTDTRTIQGFRAQPPGEPVRMTIKMASEVQTFVKEFVDFLTSLWTLARNNLRTAAEVWTFVKRYVNFLTSFWTGRRFSATLLNQVFVLYVFYNVVALRTPQTDTRTIKGFRAQPPGKPVRMRIFSLLNLCHANNIVSTAVKSIPLLLQMLVWMFLGCHGEKFNGRKYRCPDCKKGIWQRGENGRGSCASCHKARWCVRCNKYCVASRLTPCKSRRCTLFALWCYCLRVRLGGIL